MKVATKFAQSLFSRKFGLALGAFIVFVAQKHYVEAMGIVLGYLGVEGAGDAVSRMKNGS